MEQYGMYLLMGFFGVLFQVGLKLRAIQQKARLANVEFFVSRYFKDDWLTISLSLLTVVICIFLVDEFVQFSDKVMSYIKFSFFFTGYFGSDVLSRFLSIANKRVNIAIDYKTTDADTANGTLDKPTPAVLPKDKPIT